MRLPWPGSDDTTTQRFGEENEGGDENTEEEPIVKLGEGYNAQIDFTDIDANKLKALLNDGSVAKGFSLGTKIFSWPPFQKTVRPTQNINEADIIVLGADDGPKIAIVKHYKTEVNEQPVHDWDTLEWTQVPYWTGWLGADGDFKMFADGYNPDNVGEYQAIAEMYAGLRSVENAQTFAGGLEFTLNLVPFGSAALKIADHEGKWTKRELADVGILIATDSALLIIPGAKAAHGAGKISTEVAETTVKIAKGVGYGAAAIQIGIEAGDIKREGLTWQNSAELIGILFSIGAIKTASRDALNDIAKGTKLEDIVDKAVEQSAKTAGAEAKAIANGTTAAPKPITPREIPAGQPNAGKYKLVDSSGTDIAPGKVYHTVDDAKAAANSSIKSNYDPNSDTLFNGNYKLGLPIGSAARKLTLKRIADLKQEFLNFSDLNGTLTKKLDEVPFDEMGKRIFGTFDSRTNTITLYKDSDLSTLTHELLHFEQAKIGRRIGSNLIDTPAQREIIERDVLWKMLKLGFVQKTP